MKLSTEDHNWQVAALYRFFPIDDPEALRNELLPLCQQSAVRGTLIVATEGINGTIAGKPDAVKSVVSKLKTLEGFEGAEIKYSEASEMPFRRMKIRIKQEIVTMGVADIDPVADRGEYVEPQDWNALISDPQTILIDTRNAYETAVGTFNQAIDPNTASFREFPGWIEKHREQLRGRKVAMFCTGGIRCEKATAYVKSAGIDEVFHLKGGILKYLENIPENDSLWHGECFVFDERVTVKHGLAEGTAQLCRACRHPLTPEERQSQDFVEGVSCPHCCDDRSDADRERYAQRQRQVEQALARGEDHPIGRPQKTPETDAQSAD